MIQRCAIEDWLPTMSANGSHGHWSASKRKHDTDMQTTYGSLLHAGWKRITTRGVLTIALVFPQRRRRDADNLHYRCKGLIDGVKPFLVDDDTEHVELVVLAVVEPGVKCVRLELESGE